MTIRSNTTNHPTNWSENQKSLADTISSLLDTNLGATPVSLPDMRRWSATSLQCRAVLIAGAYILLFCGTQYVVGERYYGSYSKILIFLSLWGSFYLGFSLIISNVTSQSVKHIIYCNIIGELDDIPAASIASDLNKRFNRSRICYFSFLFAAIAAVISAFVLKWNLNSFRPTENSFLLRLLNWLPGGIMPRETIVMPGIGEIVIWMLGFFFLYLLSARVTYVARFYGFFAEHLRSNAIFTLDPSHSALVVDVASIGRRILFFWFGIGLSVVTLIPFFYQLKGFIILVVAAATYFSVVYGTIVFLSAERKIRDIVQVTVTSTLIELEKNIEQLFVQFDCLDSPKRDLLMQLKTMHRELSTARGYRSYFLSILSVLSPLLGPVVAAVALLNKQ